MWEHPTQRPILRKTNHFGRPRNKVFAEELMPPATFPAKV
ncbi:hypothetical protein CCHOA_08640 [Corynebacterium choanae]|uniref:Uncharacterized protein n=1 Tax=Corynebacterium choanae TaxID=1862358 RepID=A0A3G6J7T8_9CORY|nr:hypothetical protein CCHOA_08640 [Corynebacterium choanae]